MKNGKKEKIGFTLLGLSLGTVVTYVVTKLLYSSKLEKKAEEVAIEKDKEFVKVLEDLKIKQK
jgi:hypothetical protein